MTTENLTKEQKESILKIREGIYENFTWSDTKEGSNYWDKVHKALYRIANSEPKEAEKEIELDGRKYRLVEE